MERVVQAAGRHVGKVEMRGGQHGGERGGRRRAQLVEQLVVTHAELVVVVEELRRSQREEWHSQTGRHARAPQPPHEAVEQQRTPHTLRPCTLCIQRRPAATTRVTNHRGARARRKQPLEQH